MKKLLTAFVLVLASLALVACGSDSSDDTTATSGGETTSESGASAGGGAEGGSAGSGAVVDFEADPGSDLAYTSDSASAEAGEVTVNFTNPQPLSHDVAIEDSSGETIAKTEVIAEGSDATTAKLKAGEYTFYCSVPGHREAGMEGTLTVK